MRGPGSLLLLASTVSSAPLALDFSRLGPPYLGVGACSGGGGDSRLLADYAPAVRSDIYDLLFLPGRGASLQIIKVEIGGDTQSTEGVESSHEHTRGDLNCSRGYEWEILVEARRRNPDIVTYGLSWGVPAWVGAESGDGFFSDDGIAYHVDWVRCARDAHGVGIDLVGLRNERAYPYGADVQAWTVKLRAALDAAGFAGTRIAAADGAFIVADAMKSNAAFNAAVDVVNDHYPTNSGDTYFQVATTLVNKTLMASEMWDLGDSNDWAGAGGLMSDLMSDAEMGLAASVVWNLVYSFYANFNFAHVTGTNSGAGHSLMTASEPWSGHYEVNAPLAAVAHWSQFVRRGWQFLTLPGGRDPGVPGGHRNGTALLPGGGECSALASALPGPGGVADFSVVLNTMGVGAAQIVSLRLLPAPGAVLPKALHLWLSVEGALMQQLPDVAVAADGSVVFELPGSAMASLTTTTGQGWRAPAAIPASQPFPFPFSDDFDAAPRGGSARFFSDMGGVWEVTPLPPALEAAKPGGGRGGGGGADQALLQVVPADPAANGWCANPLPSTVVGNPNGGERARARSRTPCFSLARLCNLTVLLALACSLVPGYPGQYPGLASWTDYRVEANGLIDVSAVNVSGGGAAAWLSLSARVQLFHNYDAQQRRRRTSRGGPAAVAVAAAAAAAGPTPLGALESPQGYSLYVNASASAGAPGTFALYYWTQRLAWGATPAPVVAGTWYRLALECRNTTVTASLDGAVLASVQSTNSSFGNVAIGSGWHAAWWDDVNITAL